MARARIGVISDTHGALPDAAFRLFQGAWSSDELEGAIFRTARVECAPDGGAVLSEEQADSVAPKACGLILHAGDIGPQSVLDELGAIARTVAVLGNNDHALFMDSDGTVRPYASLTFEGVGIFMQHIPAEMEASLRGRGPLQPALVRTQPALAVHGHTHVPRLEAHGRRVTLCPGSPARARNGSGHAAALVDVENGRLAQVSLVRLP